MNTLARTIQIPAQPCEGCGGAHVMTMYLSPDAEANETEQMMLNANYRYYLSLLSHECFFNWN